LQRAQIPLLFCSLQYRSIEVYRDYLLWSLLTRGRRRLGSRRSGNKEEKLEHMKLLHHVLFSMRSALLTDALYQLKCRWIKLEIRRWLINAKSEHCAGSLLSGRYECATRWQARKTKRAVFALGQQISSRPRRRAKRDCRRHEHRSRAVLRIPGKDEVRVLRRVCIRRRRSIRPGCPTLREEGTAVDTRSAAALQTSSAHSRT